MHELHIYYCWLFWAAFISVRMMLISRFHVEGIFLLLKHSPSETLRRPEKAGGQEKVYTPRGDPSPAFCQLLQLRLCACTDDVCF